MQENVVSLKDITKNDLHLAGGKGANLGEMINADLPVPNGFCVTTHAFELFFLENNLYDEIETNLKNIDFQDTTSLEQQCEIIREKIKSKKLSDSIFQKIKEFLAAYDSNQSFAIRSSATAEDLPDNSFAGQQDTYLNIKGLENICNSVVSCFASLFTARAVSYRIKNNFNHSKIKLAVIVQEQIYSDYSGVMFTADPISENRNILTINACFGLGESLVSGLVNADLYKFDKKDNIILEKDIQKKELMIRSTEHGVIKENISTELSQKQVITDMQIANLSHLGIQIEKHYQKPQDIEWAIYNNKIYITQSRPITTLYPLAETFSENQAEPKIYFSINHLQVMTEPISPLGKDIFMGILPFYGNNKQQKVLHIGGRIYAELNDALSNNLTRKMISNLFKVGDQNMGLIIKQILADKRFAFLYKADKPLSDFKFLKGEILKPKNIVKVIKNVINPDKNLSANYISYIEEETALIKMRINRTKDSKQKLNAIKLSMPKMFKLVFPYALKMFTGFFGLVLLTVLLKNKVDKQYFNQLASASEGNIITEMNLELGDIADIIKKDDFLYNYFTKNSAQDIYLNLAKMPEAREFNKAFKYFLNRYGMRGQAEIDIASERWKDNPIMLIQIIIGNLSDREIGKHHKHFKHQQELSKNAENVILKASQKGLSGFVLYPVVKKIIEVIRNNISIREHHKLFLVKVITTYRNAMLDVGQDLVNKGLLNNKEDIFYLYMNEIENVVDNENIDLRNIVTKRKEDFARYKNFNPPRVITSEGEKITTKKNKSLGDNILSGSAVSSGTIEGIARVISDPQKEILNSGEILVTRFTDPAWTPLFIHAKALIMEVGGLMTHGSVVAREYGIPAVVGVENATHLIKTGQKLRVDGDSGFVEIIG